MFQKILQIVRQNKDDVMAKKLVNYLKDSTITNGALGNAYSCLLDVLITEGKYEEAIEMFEKAIEKVPIDKFNRTAVLRVKEVYERQRKVFTHNIPPKKKVGHVVNSDSDYL